MKIPILPTKSRSSMGSLLAAGLPRDSHGRLSGNRRDAAAPGGPTKVKVAYLGLTCEAAMFVAKEKG